MTDDAQFESNMARLASQLRLEPSEDGVEKLPWEELARRAFDPALHYVKPGNYSGFLLPG